MSIQKKRFSWVLWYTFAFVACTTAILIGLRLMHRSIVSGFDGFNQCCPVFELQRQTFGNFLHGRGFAMVNLQAGQGSDVFAAFGSLDFFNPISIILSLVLHSNEAVYVAFLFVNLYLCGLFAGIFVKKNVVPQIDVALNVTVALMYAFTGYNSTRSVTHIWFVNGPLYLILLLLCVEKILHEHRWIWMTLCTALAVISDYYIAYMVLLLTAIYVLIRLVLRRVKEGKPFVKDGLILLGSTLVGVMISAAVLLPTVSAYLNSARLDGEMGGISLIQLFPIRYYANLLTTIITPGFKPPYGTAGCFLPIAVLALARLFRRGKTTTVGSLLRICFCVVTIMLCMPVFGKILNGFGYVSNRWSFALLTVMTMIMAFSLPVLSRPGYEDLYFYRRVTIVFCCGMIVFETLGLVFRYDNLIKTAATSFMIGIVMLIAICILIKKNIHSISSRLIALLTAIACVCYFMFNCVLTKESLRSVNVDRQYSKLAEAQMKDIDTGLLRTDTGGGTDNYAAMLGYYGTGGYWSIIPGFVHEYYNGLELSTRPLLFRICGLGGSTAESAVAGVGYAARNERNTTILPYGFEETSAPGIYENEYTLAMGIVFHEVIRSGDYAALPAVEKQSALISGAIVEEAHGLDSAVLSPKTREIDFTIESIENVEITEGRLTGKKGGTFRIIFEGQPDTETWFRLTSPLSESVAQRLYDKITVQTEAGTNVVFLPLHNTQYYFEQDGILINLGYSENGMTEAICTLNYKLDIRFDEMHMYALPMDYYRERTTGFRAEMMKDVVADTNSISGIVYAASDGILQISVPYSTGWKVYIDNEETDSFLCGGMYTGVEISGGEHTVELYYCSPYAKEGFAISLGAILFVVALQIFSISRRKKRT